MIKKTFSTLKKNPKIMLLMLYPFAWKLTAMLMLKLDLLSDNYLMQYSLNFSPTILVRVILLLAFLVVWVLIIYPAAQYLVYEACIDNVQKGWHKKGMQYWWRPLMLGLTIAFVVFVLSLLWQLGPGMLVMNINGMESIIVGSIIIAFTVITVLAFASIGNAAIFAEEIYGNGLGNIFKAGARHFLKLFGVVFVAALPYLAYYALSLTDFSWSSISNIFWAVEIGSSLWLWIMASFVSVFAMHCYLDYKDHEEQKNDLLNIGDLEAKEN